MERALEDIYPILDVEHDLILSKGGDMTIAYGLQLPEIFTLSVGDYEAFHQAWIKALKVLPRHCVFHKQDWYEESRYEANFQNPEPNFLSHSSERYFHERPFLSHTCYVFITKKPSGRKPASSLLSNLIRRSIVPAECLTPSAVQDFRDRAAQFSTILKDSGYATLEQLSDEAILSTTTRAGVIEKYLHLSSSTLLGDIRLKESLQVADKHVQLFTLSAAEDLPALCGARINYEKYSTDKTRFSIGFASALGSLLPCNHIYNQYLFLGDATATLRNLERKHRRLQSLSAYSRENAISRDATSAFLNEAIQGGRLPVKAHFNILAWTEHPAALPELKNKVSSALVTLDATAKLETVGAPQLFWAGIPGNEADFPMNDTFDTFCEPACCFLNLETAYRSSVSPVGIRLGDRETGRPLHVDLSDEPMRKGICTNRNKFILGPSGSGKSFFTNHMVRSYFEQGTHIVLVDVGHSYRGLCDLLKGYYFTYEEKTPLCFNPFYIPKGESLDTEKKESIKTLLLALWKRENEAFNRSEYVALSSALQLYYAHLKLHPGLFPCFNTFYEYLRNDFIEVLKTDKVKEKDFDVSNFLYVLRPYYKGGEFDFLLNATENLELLSQRFIVFELDNIKDHPILFPVVTLIIMDVFIAKMRKLKGIRKMILIEEAWKAIAREGMAEYIKYLFKTVRKFFGEAIVVTQDIEDIISSPVVKQSIINNSDCKILLDQSKYLNRFSVIEELLGLSEKEKTQVLSINKANDPLRKYKEVFISLGGTLSKVYRLEVSPEEYLAYTTEESEKLSVQAYAERFGGDRERGIAELLRDEGKQNEERIKEAT